MMLLALTMILAGAANDGLTQSMPVRVVDAWKVEVGPGAVTANGKTFSIAAPTIVEVAPPPSIAIADECHSGIAVYNAQAAGWAKGAKLVCIRAEECSSTNLLFPETLRIKPAPGNVPTFTRGKDYDFDDFWATFGRLNGGAILPRQTVFIDYAYSPARLDAVMIDAVGNVRLAEGACGNALLHPPEPRENEIPLANILVPGKCPGLTDDNLYPIDFAPETADAPKPGETQAEKLLPNTLRKLREGQPLTIVAFGDSVTEGGGVKRAEDWYQNQFVTRLAQCFPRAAIRLINAGWGGASSRQYLEAPAGGAYDFVRDVIDPKPDLVTIEFVNDAYLDEAGVAAHYGALVERLNKAGAEVALITPHLIRQDWMKAPEGKVKEDPRPYVRGLKQFAQAKGVALADGSTGYCNLWRKGIPYMTLMANNINHPDARGHALFADALMAMFPEK